MDWREGLHAMEHDPYVSRYAFLLLADCEERQVEPPNAPPIGYILPAYRRCMAVAVSLYPEGTRKAQALRAWEIHQVSKEYATDATLEIPCLE